MHLNYNEAMRKAGVDLATRARIIQEVRSADFANRLQETILRAFKKERDRQIEFFNDIGLPVPAAVLTRDDSRRFAHNSYNQAPIELVS